MLIYRNKIIPLAIASLALMAATTAFAAEGGEEAPPAPLAAEEIPALQSGVAGSYLSSRFARAGGDMEAAIHYLQELYAETPYDADVASQLLGLSLLNGDMSVAMDVAARMEKEHSNDSLKTLLLVLKEIKNKQTAQASQTLDQAMEGGVNQLWAPLISAWLDVAQHKLVKPLAFDDLGVDVKRATPAINYHLALLNAYAGFKDEAAKNFKDAVENPASPPPRVIESLLQFYDENSAPEILEPVVNAYFAANPGHTQQPELMLPRSPQAGVAEVLFTMGTVMSSVGMTQDTIIYLQAVLYLQPDFAQASLLLADAYANAKLYEKANGVYGSIPVQKKEYLRAQLGLAVSEERLGKTQAAAKRLDKLASQFPKEHEPLVAKGDLLRVHGQFEQAAASYSQALARISGAGSAALWPIWFARGASYERLGKWQLAEKDLLQALKLKPGQPDVLNYLGFTWLTRGEKLQEAHDMIAKALSARPTDPQIIDSMGWSLYLLGEYEDAAAYMEKAAEFLPSDPTVNDHLGDVYWRQGRKTEARFQWERALTFSPDAKTADIIRQKLKDGLPAMNAAAARSAPVIAAEQAPNATIP